MTVSRLAAVPSRVSTLELFFDLVFVFTITQVTAIIVGSPTWAGMARAAVILAVIFFMYGGYAWVTNTSPPDTPARRLVLLAGMGSFFVASLCVPDAFGANGVAFGLAYLVIIVCHGAGFLVFVGRSALPGMARLLSCNLASAGLVLAAGWVHGRLDWLFWLAAIAIQCMTPLIARVRVSYRISADHFAERHGLVILIVLGESLVSIGLAGEHALLTFRVAVGVLSGLVAVAALWFVYFVHDDDLAAAALDRADPAQRPMLAVTGYFYAHLAMIFGVLMLAAGARLSVNDLTGAASWPSAWLVAGGAAVYLAGSAGFRIALAFASPAVRGIGAVVCLALASIGVVASAATELVAVGCVVGTGLALERSPLARQRPSSGRMPA